MRAASPGRRLLAFLFSECVLWGVIAASGWAVLSVMERIERLRSEKTTISADSAEINPVDAAKGSKQRASLARAAARGALATMTIGNRQRRAGSRRTLYLRRVDARSGGSITVRSAALDELFDQACNAIGDFLVQGRAKQDFDRVRALSPQMHDLRDRYADDPDKLMEATEQLREMYALHLFRTWGWVIASRIAILIILLLGFKDGRTVRDRVTGTVVIVDR